MTKGQMFCEKDHKIKFYDLKNYLIRESKNTDYRCFVLEAINTLPHHKSLVVRIGFKEEGKFRECFDLIKATIVKMERVKIKEELGIQTTEGGKEGKVEEIGKLRDSNLTSNSVQGGIKKG